ncbi:unnamed protein product [Prorocentrum cordatum]|uniref:Pentacotripeptide-repeat region of PRORP domain-containing protein n=1 Tax=Prorocentrum cordatum TaxID=2364126 RepID=A0ABN9RSN2_9DINO|nr:unnamed protein product [Polarella glacialis]
MVSFYRMADFLQSGTAFWSGIAGLIVALIAPQDSFFHVPAPLEEVVIVMMLLPVFLPVVFGKKIKKRVVQKKVDDLSSDADLGSEEKASNMTALGAKLFSAAKAGDLRLVERLEQRMLEAGEQPTALCVGAVMNAYTKAGDVSRVELWLGKLPRDGPERPNVVCLNIVISAWAKAGNVDRAEACLQEMRRLGVDPDVLSYNTLIDACARLGDAERAEHWLREMRKDGLQPNVISYSSVIHAAAKAGDRAGAEAWLGKMERGGVSPNAICYNAVIHACVSAGSVAGAAGWIDRMSTLGVMPTATSYSALMDPLAKSGDLAQLEVWLRRMVDAGVESGTWSATACSSAPAIAPATRRRRAPGSLACRRTEGMALSPTAWSSICLSTSTRRLAP